MSTVTSRVSLSRDSVKTGLCGLFGIVFLALALPAALEPMTFWTGIVLGDYGYVGHELHHLVLGAVFPVLLLGVIVQAYRPRKRIAALHTALGIWLALTFVFTVGEGIAPVQFVLLGLLGAVALTHPAGRDQLPSLTETDRPLLVIALLTAVAAIGFAAIELNAHLTANDGHVEFDHYLFMATTGLSIAGLSLYASVRPTGWRFPAYAAAFFIGVIGAGSMLYPGSEQGSSLGVALGALVVLWALVFLLVAERETLSRLRE